MKDLAVFNMRRFCKTSWTFDNDAGFDIRLDKL